MSEATGFRAYHIYNVVKYAHFGSKTYDVAKHPLCKKAQFLSKWNDEVRHKGVSLIYHKLDGLFTNRELIRLFAYYYLEDSGFYVTDVIDDDLATYKKREAELEMIEDVLETDMLRIFVLMTKNGKSLKEILFADTGTPYVLQMYDRKIVCANTLVALDDAFGIGSSLSGDEGLNVVEAEKRKKHRIIFDKYKQIVYDRFDFDVKEFVKKLYEDNFN
jgi:hypothetical protein